MQNQTDVITAKDLGCKLVEYIEERYKDSNSISGIRSGFPTIDAMTHGFQKGNLITVCSNLRYYKKCFVMQLLHSIVVKEKSSFGFFSYTMNDQEFGLSMISRETLVPVSKVVAGMLSKQDLNEIQVALGLIFESQIVVPKINSSSFEELCKTIRETVEQYDLRIIYIDSLNTIPIEDDSRSYKNRFVNILKKLKMMAVELDISIITDYYCYEEDKDILMGDINKTELLLQKTDFLYSYSDVVLQLQNVSVNKDDFDEYELEIHCNTYGLARAKSLLFDLDKDEFFEEENN